MLKPTFKFLVPLAAILMSGIASAEVLDRPSGIKIGQRLTLKPYVSFSATYDSNVGGRHSNEKGDVMWTVNPNLGIDYHAENWALLLNAYYNYYAYCKGEYNRNQNQHSYGQTLRWNWRNEAGEGVDRGWALMIQESFNQYTMCDDMTLNNGRGYTADRRQLSFNAAVQRRFNELFHAEANAGYYMLDYLNDTDVNGLTSMYGWQRWNATGVFGFAPSRWTDILAMVGYHGYRQDNVDLTGYSHNSQGYTAQFGVGSYMTERISYRALLGWSRFEYANNASSSDGFVYTLSGSWKIAETWNMMLLASSYYQPSERERAAKSRTDAVSWGLAKSMVRGKLRGTLDLTYRHQTNERITQTAASDYAIDVVSARLGLHYSLNRFLGLFAYGEYQRSWNDDGDAQAGYCDYDRWRVTGGFRLTY